MINEVLAGYLAGVVNVMIERKPAELMGFLLENIIYIDKMVEFINNKSISELLIKIFCENKDIGTEQNTALSEKRIQICKIFIEKMQPTNNMLDILNACFVLVSAISIDSVTAYLSEENYAKSLYKMSIEGDKYS